MIPVNGRRRRIRKWLSECDRDAPCREVPCSVTTRLLLEVLVATIVVFCRTLITQKALRRVESIFKLQLWTPLQSPDVEHTHGDGYNGASKIASSAFIAEMMSCLYHKLHLEEAVTKRPGRNQELDDNTHTNEADEGREGNVSWLAWLV